MNRIGLACDHAGFECKEYIKSYLETKLIEVKDFGTHSTESVDYPDFIHPAAKALVNKEIDLAIIFCGSGNGVNITANKYAQVRSALCWQPEIASLAKQHNNANCLAIPARFVSLEEALLIVEAFLNTPFEGGRHQARVDKIAC